MSLVKSLETSRFFLPFFRADKYKVTQMSKKISKQVNAIWRLIVTIFRKLHKKATWNNQFYKMMHSIQNSLDKIFLVIFFGKHFIFSSLFGPLCVSGWSYACYVKLSSLPISRQNWGKSLNMQTVLKLCEKIHSHFKIDVIRKGFITKGWL